MSFSIRAMKVIALETARRKAGLTQDALSAKAGVSQSVISKLELGQMVRPGFTTVVKLAKALGVNPMQLRCGPTEDRQAVAS